MDKQWKVVPVEPTPEMIDAYERTNPEDHWAPLPDEGDGVTRRQRDGDAVIYYRAMIAAAPQPPSASDEPNALDLIAAIRKECTGREVWRVQDPDGAYCLERSRDESFNPERECREWLADHVKRFPEHAAEHQYHVASTRVYTSAESLALAAADLLAALAPSPGVDAADRKPVAWLIDWPDEPDLGHYFAEEPTDTGRCRALVLAEAAPSPAAGALEPHPPHRDCMCADCKPSFEPDQAWVTASGKSDAINATSARVPLTGAPSPAASAGPEPAPRITFPTHLRKMWSGSEVQAWLDDLVGAEPTRPTARGSLARYRKWQAEQATPGCSATGDAVSGNEEVPQ